jgi:hypothetical protein
MLQCSQHQEPNAELENIPIFLSPIASSLHKDEIGEHECFLRQRVLFLRVSVCDPIQLFDLKESKLAESRLKSGEGNIEIKKHVK